MIEKIILINSANFNFLEVDLKKDLFFLGDNGSGKTTLIRAIHYLFSGDVRNLGIPTDKDGFKEYYFRYPNSYMIYVFEDFFIFMYKTSGEIVKLFSKQKFDLSRIIDENSKLYDLDVIKRYAKEPNLKKTVKSLSEYREIIYGNNKRYLDFKFTSIQSTDVFIGLFNEIFNIDKSIIDSKSIKQAIQTTLDYEKKVIDFNHEEYLQKIYEFQSEYKFFREFEKQKESIDSASNLKEILLSYESEADKLKEYILYRVALERKELSKSGVNSSIIEVDLAKTKEFNKIKSNTLSRCEERFKEQANALELDIQRIKELKDKFSQDNILTNRDLADKHEEILNRQSELNQSYIKLKSGFENELDNIKKEITELIYKRDKELIRELESKKFNQTQLLKNRLQEDIQRQELDLNTREDKAQFDVNDLKEEIVLFEKDIQTQKSLLEKSIQENKTVIQGYKNSYETDKDKITTAIKQRYNSIDTKTRENNNFIYDLNDLQREKEIELSSNENSYKAELQSIDINLHKYKVMISSKPNSFKEYLNEEVDGWESELYPILDDTLLDMSIDELKPKLLQGDKLFSIELQKQSLKKILTKDEANIKIEALELQKVNLDESYRESLLKLESKYTKSKESIEEKVEFTAKEIENLNKEIELLKENIKTIGEQLDTDVAKADESARQEQEKYNQSIDSLISEIKYSHEEIEKIYKSIRLDKIEVVNTIKDLNSDYEDDLQNIHSELNRWLKTQQEDIDKLVIQKEELKHNITKDDRVKQLENQLRKQELELSDSLKAKEFLSEYEKSKDYITTLFVKENKLENIKIKNAEFKKRLVLKIENYEYKIDELIEAKKALVAKDKRLKKGIEYFESISIDFESLTPRESNEFLYILVERYNAVLLEYKNKKIDLKSKLDKINTLKNRHNEIDINFKFQEYDEYIYISQSPNILEKIDEVVDFKNKRLEMVKQGGHKKFKNFVNNLLPQKMSVFSDSEDKFLSQVSKINKNLSDIDFGVIKDIKIDTKIGDKKSVAKLLNELNDNVSNLSSLLNESSLFYDKDDVLLELNGLEMKFKEIKSELKGNSISLQDTIDLSLSFNENGKYISQVSQLKNESSTGGSMLLKIAIAISILKLFITEDKTPFFLIVDEVSRLHSVNQEKLREFANSKGFGIVFVTPEPTYSKPEAIKYYRFRKNKDDEFEAIELNV